ESGPVRLRLLAQADHQQALGGNPFGGQQGRQLVWLAGNVAGLAEPGQGTAQFSVERSRGSGKPLILPGTDNQPIGLVVGQRQELYFQLHRTTTFPKWAPLSMYCRAAGTSAKPKTRSTTGRIRCSAMARFIASNISREPT